MIRVGVTGIGRMGRMVCRGVAEADDLELVAAVSPKRAGEPVGPLIGLPEVDLPISPRLAGHLEAETEVAVDFTTPDVVREHVEWYVDHGIHAVVGTTGLGPEDLEGVAGRLEGAGANVLVAPNFAIGAVLMERFAAMASRVLPAVEVIELHHDGKVDAPSGTALATARRLVARRAEAYRGPEDESVAGVRGGDLEGVRVHSVRLPGLVAHQEVLFGGPGQVLTIRHDATDRSCFMPGVLLAVREIAARPGLTVGLEPLLDLGEVG